MNNAKGLRPGASLAWLATLLLWPAAGAENFFKAVEGTENGTQAILDQHTEAIKAKSNGKPSSHALWLWGLGNVDYDNDGDQDLIVSYHGPRHGRILKNQWKETGKLTFVDVTTEMGIENEVPSADWNPVAWDFDGDGFLDVAGLFDDQPTTCLLNEGGKRFVKAPFHLHPINKGYGITDCNGDGHPDIVQYKKTITKMIYDPAAKKFNAQNAPNELPAGTPDAVKEEWNAMLANKEFRYLAPYYFTGSDLNGDGKSEVVLTGFSGYSGPCAGRFLFSQADGNLKDETEAAGLPKEGTPLLLHDLNGDGALDVLIVAGAKAGQYLNDGKGKFTFVSGPLTDQLKKRVQYFQRVWVVDFNNDGAPDLAFSDRRMGGVYAFLNDGKGAFTQILKTSGWDADPLVLFDANDDGLLDVIVGDKKGCVTVHLNACPTPGRWAKLYPRLEKPNPFGVDTRFEAFRAGDLGKSGARPFWTETAHADGTPVLLGLGAAETFDLRVTLPGKEGKVVDLKGLATNKQWKITADGKHEEFK